MKFKEVTWYSKLLAAILFIVLPFAGFYAGMKYQEATTSPREAPIATDSAKLAGWKTIVFNEKIIVKTKYENGLLRYSGTVQMRTPCEKLKDETTVLESFPEQVQIRLVVEPMPSLLACAQRITPANFSGQVQVSEKAVVSVYLNGKKVG